MGVTSDSGGSTASFSIFRSSLLRRVLISTILRGNSVRKVSIPFSFSSSASATTALLLLLLLLLLLMVLVLWGSGSFWKGATTKNNGIIIEGLSTRREGRLPVWCGGKRQKTKQG